MINRALRSATDSLMEGSKQIAQAASQISASSRDIAKGASEQAATLEQTSSSIEEMSGMTRANAESAHKAQTVSDQARQAAG